MDDKRFWSMIEDAWQDVEDSAAARKKLAQGKLDEESATELAQQSLDGFVPALQASLEQLPKDELLQFDRILERKLYEIDRADIQEHTDGSRGKRGTLLLIKQECPPFCRSTFASLFGEGG